MQKELIQKITEYVENNIGYFHDSRVNGLSKLKLKNVLKKKNPYLFKAKNLISADDIVNNLMNAYLSSSEETMFGDWLEGLAIFVCHEVYGGSKSSATGIDLEFNKEGIKYIVSVKSGPNWGNHSQVTKLKEDFVKAKRTLRTSNSKLNIIAINGCCYGRDNKPDKGEYFKICGQEFWTLISDNEQLFIEIIKPLENQAKERNNEFQQTFAKIKTKFIAEFITEFCKEDYAVDWEKLVEFNSKKLLTKN